MLNLTGNIITGSMPDSIGRMASLEYLGLGNNTISGEPSHYHL